MEKPSRAFTFLLWQCVQHHHCVNQRIALCKALAEDRHAKRIMLTHVFGYASCITGRECDAAHP